MKNNQKGSSALIILLILVVLVAAGLLAYRMIHDKNKNKTQNTTQNNTTNDTAKTSNNTTTPTTSFLSIPEWGVKIAMRDASKVQVTVNNKSGMIFGEDPYEAEAVPDFIKGAVQDDSCKPGLGLYRSKTAFADSSIQKKVGDYYYAVTGGPGSCEKDADNQLKTRFLHDFDPNNISAL